MHDVGDNFENSTALVITFTVLNKKDSVFQQMALEWEKQFLKLVSNYSSQNIALSYSAEVWHTYLSGIPQCLFMGNSERLFQYLFPVWTFL